MADQTFTDLIDDITSVDDSINFLFPTKEIQPSCVKAELSMMLEKQLTEELSRVSILGAITLADGSRQTFCGKFIDA